VGKGDHKPNLQPNMSFHPNPDVIAQRMDDVIVLVHMHTNGIYELNTTAARVWELLEAGYHPKEIREQMLSEYDVEAAVLENELSEVLDSFLERNLLLEGEA
jgi:hypothetical protein